VSEATGQTIMLDVYDRLYEPLSMMFAHSGPMALLRHVDPRGRVVDQPMKPWTDRAALRTAPSYLSTPLLSVLRGNQGAAPVIAANSPVKSSKQGPQASRWAAIPG
jgi:hypothetical protein